MRFCFTQLCFAILLAVQTGSADLITTTVFISAPQRTAPTHHTRKCNSTTSIQRFTLLPSAKAIATGSSKTNTTSASNSNSTLPKLPLSSPELEALTSFLKLITSIPSSILDAGSEATTEFFTSLSTCLQNETSALEAAASDLAPQIASLAQNIKSELAAVPTEAASLIASLTAKIPGALSTAKAVEKSLVSEITQAAAPLVTKASAIFQDAKSEGQVLASEIANAAAPIVTKASAIFADVKSEAKELASKLHLPFKPRRRDFKSTLGQIADIEACLTAAANTNTLFQVGNCALKIGEAVPVARLLKTKSIIEGTGVVKTVQALGNAKSPAEVVKIAGTGVLDVLNEVTGIGDAVEACKFLVE